MMSTEFSEGDRRRIEEILRKVVSLQQEVGALKELSAATKPEGFDCDFDGAHSFDCHAATVAEPSDRLERLRLTYAPDMTAEEFAHMWPEFKAWQRGKQSAQQQAEPKHATAKAGQHCVNCGLTLGQQTSWCNCEANRAVEAQQAEPVGDECEDSGSLLGDGFVLEFERWNDVTGALPRSSSWVAEVSDIIQRAAQSGQRAGVAEGWCFYLADFSMNARNPANWGTVMLKRGDASSKWWHALSDEEREKIDLFVSGRGTTFEAALKAANEKAAAAPTQQKERGE